MTNDRAITAADEAEAAIWAEGTKYTKADILRAYRSHLNESADPLDIQRFCEDVLKIGDNWYWLGGECYCPACVECDTPAIESHAATRGPNATSRCHCCGRDANG